MRKGLVIIASMVALSLAAAASSDDNIFPSTASVTVSRTPDQLYLVPGDDIEVQVTITNNTAEPLRGICFTEHIPSVFDVYTDQVTRDGVPITDYIYELSEHDIYPYTDACRWIIEEPGKYGEMDNPLPPGGVLVISYRIATTGLYYSSWPPYFFSCERALPEPEYCFGYCDEMLLINEDADGDEMADLWEIHFFSDLAHDGTADGDEDGLSDLEEYLFGTDPTKDDTDGDGLSDGDEVTIWETNPLLDDTDGDGLNDGEEVNSFNTDPLLDDTDSDGLSDYEEAVDYGTDPVLADSDDDGLSDYEEVYYDGLSGYAPYDPVAHPSGTDTDANDADSDDDGWSDSVEFYNGTDPLVASEGPGTVRVNFQASESQTPAGFCPADASNYSPCGYGWR